MKVLFWKIIVENDITVKSAKIKSPNSLIFWLETKTKIETLFFQEIRKVHVENVLGHRVEEEMDLSSDEDNDDVIGTVSHDSKSAKKRKLDDESEKVRICYLISS